MRTIKNTGTDEHGSIDTDKLAYRDKMTGFISRMLFKRAVSYELEIIWQILIIDNLFCAK